MGFELFASMNVFCLIFEVRHPRCVGSIAKKFLCVTLTVEYNYISSSSTVGIQLHVHVHMYISN